MHLLKGISRCKHDRTFTVDTTWMYIWCHTGIWCPLMPKSRKLDMNYSWVVQEWMRLTLQDVPLWSFPLSVLSSISFTINYTVTATWSIKIILSVEIRGLHYFRKVDQRFREMKCESNQELVMGGGEGGEKIRQTSINNDDP